MSERSFKAQRGSELRCKGWRQETILRLLENNLENAENPADLVIYMSWAKAARDWKSFDQAVAALKALEEDQTLVMQSGRPVGRFPSQGTTPLVLMANGNVVGGWAGDDDYRALERKGLTIMPGMTAAAWQYIGSQGILQGTYETFMTAARIHFDGSLAGRLIVTGGCGGMSGAQPLAGQLAGAATLVVEVDEKRIQRRLDSGYCQRMTDSLDEALRWCDEARVGKTGLSVGLVANIADVLEELIARGVTPAIVTDQTIADPVTGYVPSGMSVEEAASLRKSDPETLKARSNETLVRHVSAMLALKERGSIVFEYGNNLRKYASQAGLKTAFGFGSFIEAFIRPLFCEGIGPFRWIAASGEPDDIRTIDDLLLTMFPSDHRISSWIRTARDHVQFTGLPARIGWLGLGERRKLAVAVNDLVSRGALKGPIAFTRDHLDSGSATLPHRETENMADGSDAISDWPILNALLNCASGADLVAVHGMGNWAQSAGVTTIATGTKDAEQRLSRVMDNDPGIGVLRHASAGYETARETARSVGIGIAEQLVEPSE
ncbi:urocanate hydratase [Rhizobium rhizogenes]|uniref:urocanate hydratase n=1 Tax=Rhizobium rhizogenes TaxID=359 RepID=UPI001573A783|nr:urocanate hydratase [Rhizobium rhizogenes]NTH22883.1 urocanate hydratase [Rhizobium rhizogenes]NTH35912.1 urocanate hydratase [Rhizobium rhizogenes]